MLYIPRKGIIRADDHNLGSVGTINMGTSVTTGGSASTKGTAVQLTASTLYDAYMITIFALNYSSAGSSSAGCLDILIGASTEEVLIPNLLMGNCGGQGQLGGSGPRIWTFPLYIPAGSRLAAQVAGTRTSTAMRVGYQLHGGNGSPYFPCGTKVTTYGIGTVPAATGVTPGTSGAEGSWTQITASTSENHIAVVPSYQINGDVSIQLEHLSLDIAMGAAAAEQLISGPYSYRLETKETCSGPDNPLPTFCDIPSGTRLAVRASTNAGANNTNTEAALHCVS